MADSILLSGPAGSGKSQAARKLLAEASGPTVAADFQSIVAALLLQERGPDGKFPARPDWVLPMAEYLRRVVLTEARERGIPVVATNSDGSPDRRKFLLGKLGPQAREKVLDPGEEIAKSRLADPQTGELSEDCTKAVGRWYGRIKR